MGMQRVIVSMPDELVAAIDKAAKEQDRSRSWMIRHAAEQAYAKPAVRDSGERYTIGTGDPTSHPFAPREGNALRCRDCTYRKRDHRQEQV